MLLLLLLLLELVLLLILIIGARLFELLFILIIREQGLGLSAPVDHILLHWLLLLLHLLHLVNLAHLYHLVVLDLHSDALLLQSSLKTDDSVVYLQQLGILPVQIDLLDVNFLSIL